jgi:hypothetical protein
MNKLDLAKQYKAYYTAKKQPALLQIEPAKYVSIQGKGDPSSPEFGTCVQALFTVAYTIKSNSKAVGKDFTVAKLEGLWWFDENRFKVLSPEEASLKVPRNAWEYRLLIRLPEWITESDVKLAKEQAGSKKATPGIQDTSYFEMEEGQCIQILHTGAFEREPETLAVMHAFMKEKGLDRNGLHHEIYLSDFRKISPERLKTILRQPVR